MGESAPEAVTLNPWFRDKTSPFVDTVLASMSGSVSEALTLAERLGALSALPGRGVTLALWEALATLGADDLGSVRAVEPHLDAVAILEQAGMDGSGGSWGVFAAEGGLQPLEATPADGGWTLSGVKPWCSLAAVLDHALVTARIGDERGLFAIDLTARGVSTESGSWHSRGLAEIPSESVRFDAVAATPVGAPGWYLERAGFAWGGIGVAACWYGGAVGVARTLLSTALERADDQVLLMHLGAVDVSLQSARRALSEAAEAVDAGRDVRLLARRVRSTVALACEDTIMRAGHALGPAPLARDELHAKRVADLGIYVRQHHAERDDISLGRAIVGAAGPPW